MGLRSNLRFGLFLAREISYHLISRRAKPTAQENIPPNLFQIWHDTSQVPKRMHTAIEKVRDASRGFQHFLYDDSSAEKFLLEHFGQKVYSAYQKLIPYAYRSDLLRYCLLFKLGGVYVDVKYIPIGGFQFSELLGQQHLCSDVDGYGVYNAIIASPPNDAFFQRIIDRVVRNAEESYYGDSPLSPTGPWLLRSELNDGPHRFQNLEHACWGNDPRYRFVKHHRSYILRCYSGYNEDCRVLESASLPHYSVLWKNRQIYR